MVPITRRDDASNPMAQAVSAPRGVAPHEDGNRQSQMGAPSFGFREQGDQPDYWLVPDTRDDIVVSRMSDD
jgi:hypothetical protein